MSRYITRDPKVKGSRPCIKGTGITTEIVFDRFMAGESEAELAADYNQLDRFIRAAIRYEVERLQSITALIVNQYDGSDGKLLEALEKTVSHYCFLSSLAGNNTIKQLNKATGKYETVKKRETLKLEINSGIKHLDEALALTRQVIGETTDG